MPLPERKQSSPFHQLHSVSDTVDAYNRRKNPSRSGILPNLLRMPSICKTCDKSIGAKEVVGTCFVCRRVIHYACLKGVSSTALREAAKEESNVRLVCQRDECQEAKLDPNPLYSESHMNAIIAEDVEIMFKEKSTEVASECERLSSDMKELNEKYEILVAKNVSDNSASEFEALKNELKATRDELKSAQSDCAHLLKELAAKKNEKMSGVPHPDLSLIQGLLDEAKNEIAALEKEKLDFKDKLSAMKESLVQELANLKNELNAQKDQNIQLRADMRTVVNDFKAERSVLVRDYDVTIKGLRRDLELAKEGTAPVDMHIPAADLKELTATFVSQMDALKERIDELTRKIGAVGAAGGIAQSESKNDVITTYASALSKPMIESMRTIKIKATDVKMVSERLHSDKECQHLGISSVRAKGNGIYSVRCKSGAAAQAVEEHFKVKFAGDIDIVPVKGTTPQIKILGIKSDLSDEALMKDIEDQNYWLKEGGAKINRRYEMKGRRGGIYYVTIVDCDVETQIEMLKRRAIVYGFSDRRVFEHVELLSCLKCQRYGHFSADCKFHASCKHCAEEHKITDCPNKNKPAQCANCKRAKLDATHSANAHFCKSRTERMDGLKNAALRSKNFVSAAFL